MRNPVEMSAQREQRNLESVQKAWGRWIHLGFRLESDVGLRDAVDSLVDCVAPTYLSFLCLQSDVMEMSVGLRNGLSCLCLSHPERGEHGAKSRDQLFPLFHCCLWLNWQSHPTEWSHPAIRAY